MHSAVDAQRRDLSALSGKNFPDLLLYCKIQVLPYRIVPDVMEELKEGAPKMLALDTFHPEHIEEFRRHMAPYLEGKLDLFLSQTGYLELVPAGINKGNALRMLCSRLGVPVSRSVAAGDAENDLQMIKAAGIGVSMANGDPILKANADYVTELDNNHDGVAEILRKFF